MKKEYGITSLTVRNLENNEFFQLMSESRSEVAAFIKENKVDGIYTTKLDEMDKLLEQLQGGLHQTKSSKLVASLDQADRERDDALGTLQSLVRAFARVKDAATKEAYEPLSQLLKNYTGLAATSLEKETEGINHLLQELKKPAYQTALAKLHLEAHVDSLAAAQKAFEKVYKERLTELKGKTPSQNKNVRLKLQEIYDFLVDFTAIIAYAYPERTHVVNLRDHLNTIRSRYKKRKPAKKVTEVVGSVN